MEVVNHSELLVTSIRLHREDRNTQSSCLHRVLTHSLPAI